MGIGSVVLVSAAVGSLLACIKATLLGGAAVFLMRDVASCHRRFLPQACSPLSVSAGPRWFLRFKRSPTRWYFRATQDWEDRALEKDSRSRMHSRSNPRSS